MELKGRKVLVVGAGKSGIGCCRLLKQEEACPVLLDNGKGADPENIKKRLCDAGLDAGSIEIRTGDAGDLSGVDIAVLSPGVPLNNPAAVAVKEAGIPVWGEVELAYRCGKGTVTAITGTNGKTTTTALTGELLKTTYDDVQVVGNIGDPYTEHAHDMTDDTRVVLEISSFQLETIEKFHPHVSVITNITPDHLDRHGSMENYIDAKFRVAENQTEEDYIVLNYEDPVLRERAEGLKPQVIWFSSKQKIKGFYYSEGAIFDNTEGINERLIRAEEMNILGLHNMENAMAAIAMAKVQGVPVDTIIDALKVFRAVEHRIEYVRTLDDIIYYNDSKGTNTDAAIKAIEAMTRPVVVIGGGYDKHSEYDDWIGTFPGRVRALVLIGETKEKIAACADKYGFKDHVFADDLEDAVEKARKLAHKGDAVLLSPACASWDMFKNYEERGRMFKALVNELK